jgi:hypothetical protein
MSRTPHEEMKEQLEHPVQQALDQVRDAARAMDAAAIHIKGVLDELKWRIEAQRAADLHVESLRSGAGTDGGDPGDAPAANPKPESGHDG